MRDRGRALPINPSAAGRFMGRHRGLWASVIASYRVALTGRLRAGKGNGVREEGDMRVRRRTVVVVLLLVAALAVVRLFVWNPFRATIRPQRAELPESVEGRPGRDPVSGQFVGY